MPYDKLGTLTNRKQARMRMYTQELWAVLSRRGCKEAGLWDVALAACRNTRSQDNGCSACRKGTSEIFKLGGVLPPGEWQRRRDPSPVVKGEIIGKRHYPKRRS